MSIWLFVLLCLIDASRWLFEGAFPTAAPTLTSEAAGCFLTAIIFLPGTLQGFRSGCCSRGCEKLAWVDGLLAGVVLTGPGLASAAAGQALSSNNTTLALTLCPVVAAVVISTSSGVENADLTGLLWPGLAGLAALLLFIPQPVFAGARSWVGLLTMPLAVGLAAGIWSQRIRADRGTECPAFAGSTVLGLIFSAAVYGVLSLFQWRAGGGFTLHLAAVALDGLTAGLSLWTLGRLGIGRWSAQFLFVPLLGLAEGAVLLQPSFGWRAFTTFGLLSVSAVFQWRTGLRSEKRDFRYGSASSEPPA